MLIAAAQSLYCGPEICPDREEVDCRSEEDEQSAGLDMTNAPYG